MQDLLSSLTFQEHSVEEVQLALAFGLGWAAADEAHLPALPDALAQIVGVVAARISITNTSGTLVMEHAYPPAEERSDAGPLLLYEVEENLGQEYTLRLSLESQAELTPAQVEILQQAKRLIHAALDCILIKQRDRDALGEPFDRLSDREWQICQALERPDGEKQIAVSLACSRHTVHSYVKSLYRKLQVQSRLQVLDQLKRSRQKLRRRTLETFATARCDGVDAAT